MSFNKKPVKLLDTGFFKDIIEKRAKVMQEKIKVKDLPRIERPREKLVRYGPERLSNSELLAIILRTGKRGENVIELAEKILKKYGAEKLPHLSLDDLKKIKGIGIAKACQIIACFELAKRLLKERKRESYTTPKDVWDQLRNIRDNKKEHFVVFYLDTRGREIVREVISVGTLNESLVHPREVFEPAIRNLCARIIVAHNHPSGDPAPSREDIEITKRLVDAGKILGIELVDHVIVTRDSFFSFKEKGLI